MRRQLLPLPLLLNGKRRQQALALEPFDEHRKAKLVNPLHPQ